jgi:hypothetical protein
MIHKTVIGVFAALFLMIPAPAAHAQIGQWVFGIDGVQESGERISQLDDGDFISCGRNGYITRHDGTTTVIEWMITIPDFYPHDVIETNSGQIAVAGMFFVNSNQTFVAMVLLDGTGSLLSHRVYPGNDQYQLLELIQTNDEGFLIAVEVIDPSSSNRHPMLIKTDPSGMEIWMYRYDASDFLFEDAAFCFVEEEVKNDADSLYHLTGRFKGSFTRSLETLMMTVDQDGVVQAAATIGFDNHSDYGRGLRLAGDQILVTGYSKEIGEGGGTYLMLVDMGFNIMWYYGIESFSGTKEIVLNSDGQVILVGRTSFPNPVDNAAIVACEFTNPTNITGMQYGGPLSDYANDYAVDALTGGYALLGATQSFGAVEQDHYLVRTDANMNSGCNESEFAPLVVPNPIPMIPVIFDSIAVSSVSQPQMQRANVAYFEDPICEDPPDPCACVDPPVDMVGWWTMDELVGPIAADSVAGNDGNYVSSPIPSVGKVDNCLDFDGIDDYVTVPDDALLDVGTSVDGDFTIDAWIWIDTTTTMEWGPIVDKIGAGIGYEFYVHDDTLQLYLADPLMQAFLASTNPVPHNEWVHVAAIVDRTSGSRFLINGVEELAVGVPPSMSYENNSAFLIGKMNSEPLNSGSPPHYFDGKIDEVEFFNRALDTSDVRGIYNAGDCGKCKVDCNPPWDVPFCIDDMSVIVGIPVCNYSPIDATVELSFAGLTPATCGGIDGPINFTVLSPGNPLVVPGNQCVTVMVKIERPIQMVALNQVGCYEVTVTNLDNGNSSTCRGSVQDKRNLCPLSPDDEVAMVIGLPTQISIPILNTAFKSETITWRAVAYDPNMELSDNYSLDGGEPGSSAGGEIQTAIGEISMLRIDVTAMAFEFGYSDLVIYTQEEGEFYPLTSIMMKTVIAEGCTGDFNDSGFVDGGDLGLLLSAWGKCRGCPEDLNGDGLVNGGDLGILLALFGPCP